MLGARLAERAGGEELADDRRPGVARAVAADAEGLQLIVAVAADGVGRLADEQIGDMGGAEALSGAHHGGEHLLRVDGRVVAGGAVAAEVAMAAGRRRLAEIGEQRLAAAKRRLAEVDHRRKPLLLDPPLLGRDRLLGDLAAAEHHVVDAVEGERRRRAGRRARRGRSPGSSSRRSTGMSA